MVTNFLPSTAHCRIHRPHSRRHEPIGIRSGLNVTSEGGEVVVSIPHVQSFEQALEILRDLQHVVETSPSHASWVIDLSRMKDRSVTVLGAVMRYVEEFRRQQRSVFVTGLDPQILPMTLIDRLAGHDYAKVV